MPQWPRPYFLSSWGTSPSSWISYLMRWVHCNVARSGGLTRLSVSGPASLIDTCLAVEQLVCLFNCPPVWTVYLDSTVPVCRMVCRPVLLFVCLHGKVAIGLFVCYILFRSGLSVRPYIYLPVCLIVCPSPYQSICLSCLHVCMSVCLSVCPSVCSSVCSSVACFPYIRFSTCLPASWTSHLDGSLVYMPVWRFICVSACQLT